MKTLKALSLILSTLPLTAAEALPSGPGLAVEYPGDAGIERDARVVQVEQFEQADIAVLAAQWESVGAKDTMSLTADVPPRPRADSENPLPRSACRWKSTSNDGWLAG